MVAATSLAIATTGLNPSDRQQARVPPPHVATFPLVGSSVAERTAPMALGIPSIGVRARFEALSTDRRGHLRTPRNPSRVGWYADSPAPGQIGSAVVVGHVDTLTGPAVFWRLSELHPGDRVVVDRAEGRVRFTVRSVQVVPRQRFPTEAVYRPTPDRGLRLITCGGTYDPRTGHYPDNIVVFAVAA